MEDPLSAAQAYAGAGETLSKASKVCHLCQHFILNLSGNYNSRIPGSGFSVREILWFLNFGIFWSGACVGWQLDESLELYELAATLYQDHGHLAHCAQIYQKMGEVSSEVCLSY